MASNWEHLAKDEVSGIILGGACDTQSSLHQACVPAIATAAYTIQSLIIQAFAATASSGNIAWQGKTFLKQEMT